MKKIGLSLIIIFIITLLNTGTETIKIPDEAIRVRIIANSNKESDQRIKMIVKNNVELKLTELLTDVNKVDEARLTLNNNVKELDKIVYQTLNNNNYSINYGDNYFPSKTYKGIKYDSGNYESLIITLGKGLGENWWCVVFPPLCMLEAKETDSDEVEYKFFVKELINKYFK